MVNRNFVEELKWRGMLQDIVPGTEELLNKEVVSGYIGFDPTAKSLTIGNLVPVMLLLHFQKAGHKPIALVGGATGMIGDPSGKSEERNLLDKDTLQKNQDAIRKQLGKFIDFSDKNNKAEIVNNYEWFKDFSFLDFLRDVGKYITINYMMAKDSVKKRIDNGISFTEFSYQLLQGYDFFWLNKNKGVKLQMGGSDQWGNITTGIELVRRKSGNDVYGLTCPLLTKSDGTKFGKSEGQNIWLDPDLTSPYKFYQFWLNISDEEAEKYIKIFTLFDKDYIENLIQQHKQAPHLRVLQKEIAKDITIRVHSNEDYKQAVEASEILFGKGTIEAFNNYSDKFINTVFEGIPNSNIDKDIINSNINIIDFLTEKTNVFASKGEARRMISANAVAINKQKITEQTMINSQMLIKNKYLLVQKGKKNFHIIIAE